MKTKPISKRKLQDVLAKQVSLRIDTARRRIEATRENPSVANTHDLSTMLRRLLVADQVVETLFGDGFLGRRRKRIQTLRRRLGALRDVQEIRIKFESLAFDTPAAHRYAEHLRTREAEAAARLRRGKDDIDTEWLAAHARKRDVSDWLRGGVKRSPQKVVRELLDDVFAFQARAIDRNDDQAMHRMRVAFKRFRYTVELLSPTLLGASELLLRHLKRLQDALGEAHDWLVLEDDLRAWMAESGQARGMAALLRAIRQRRIAVHKAGRAYVGAELENLRVLMNV